MVIDRSATPWIGADAPRDVDEVGAQRGLAAGQTELVEADGDRGAHHDLDLIGLEQLCRRREGEALERHAVDAAQVAVVGEGDAQVVDGPAEPVLQGSVRVGGVRGVLHGWAHPPGPSSHDEPSA